MSNPLATYSFLPWLRQGIANNITQADGDSSVKLRASVPIRLNVSGVKKDGTALPAEPVDKAIALYGPGDIIGIDSNAIIKTEPRNWITNFEPNYLPYIDFYEEDFPWRYTPAAPTGERLKPWLTLVVLKESEFEEGGNLKDKPLPFFKLKEGVQTAQVFPKASELAVWAHVHVNSDLSESAAVNTADPTVVNRNITDTIQQNPDLAYSRIICPRRLEANVSYYAFVIPSFESGRLAGLGLPLDQNLVASVGAWDAVGNREFPYYYKWYFKTGAVGDFEYLVNLLKPKLADKSIGVRDMDVLHPGSTLPPINNPELEGVLKLGGALRVPFDTLSDTDKLAVKKYDEWDEHPYPHAFSRGVAQLINLADDYAQSAKSVAQLNKNSGILIENDEGDPDPIITAPLYGRWQALQQRLLKDRLGNDLPHNRNWIHELNLDPRFRVAAGLGTKVVQKNQEEYMQASWEQVGKIVEANSRLRFAQIALQISERIYLQKLITQNPDKSFVLTAPVHRKVLYQGVTVAAEISKSVVPLALTSGVLRSKLRPRGPLMKRMTFSSGVKPLDLVRRVNEGELQVAPVKSDPKGAINLSDVTADVKPGNIPTAIEQLLRKYSWFQYLPLLVLLILILLVMILFPAGIGAVASGAFALGCIALFRQFRKWNQQLTQVDALKQENMSPEAVNSYPGNGAFTISEPGTGTVATSAGRGSDSTEAIRFKEALKDSFALVQTTFKTPDRKKLDFSGLSESIRTKLNPAITISARIKAIIRLPESIREEMVEHFAPVMTYPVIDIPMYKPLSEMSSELFLPNLDKIAQNSITLLENNQKFIEAYMVGINHEMSRELLWREFPTDQRGTYFRQFWDVSGFLSPDGNAEEIRERLRDIPPIHKWSKINTAKLFPADPNSVRKNDLGSHNQRAADSGKTQLVLVVRGELLKKYPTAVIYAQKAAWGKKNNVESIQEERVLVSLSDAEQLNPPASKLKTPLFEAKIEPDIYFFGFDLDDEEARGTLNPQQITDDPGWFFVLKERPGEPRFGLDIEKADRLINWNNLSWADVGTADGNCIQLDRTIQFTTYNAAIDQENKANEEDTQAAWNPSANAAQLAYILYQVPVMVAVHASKMLPKK